MKLLLFSFLTLIAICVYFGFTDEDGSYMFIVAGFFGFMLASVLIYSKIKRGSWLSDSDNKLNGIAAPFLLLFLNLTSWQIIFIVWAACFVFAGICFLRATKDPNEK